MSHEGLVAGTETSQVLVAFNPSTIGDDIAFLPSGGVCLYPAGWSKVPLREDVNNYAVPVNLFLKEAGVRGKAKDYVTNMVYVGALAQLLDISLDDIEEALAFHFGQRRELVEQNLAVIRSAHNWATTNLIKQDPYRVTPLHLTAGQVLITGNEAAALGSVFGGVTVASWYPITPSTSLIDALNGFLTKYRRDPETGRPTYAVIQAEDEMSAAGMIMGAGWAGARAMTATSGPGISLMSEFVGLGYFAEIPAVIWDVQRVGPSTGLPTRTSQGDILFAYVLGHGDTKNVLLLPGTVGECFEFGYTAFDLAEELQTPILVMSDLDLGMNTWMTRPFDYPPEPLNRGKVMTEAEVEERGFYRYMDLDGDGIPYRTLPGNKHPKGAHFNRGTGHNQYGVYSEDPQDLLQVMDRLLRKFDTARNLVPAPVIDETPGTEIAIIAYGSTLAAVTEARFRLAASGVNSSFLRLRALPINDRVGEFVGRHRRTYVVEMNRDGQMHQILSLELPALATRLVPIAFLDGWSLTADWITKQIRSKEGLD